MPPAGTSAVVDYGNLAVPTPLAAALTGAAQFGDGTQAMNTTLLTTTAGICQRLQFVVKRILGKRRHRRHP